MSRHPVPGFADFCRIFNLATDSAAQNDFKCKIMVTTRSSTTASPATTPSKPAITAPATTDDPTSQQHLHYTDESSVPPGLLKYWHQRHSLFTLYDSGIQLPATAWYSVTPEAVAVRIASELAAAARPEVRTVIDLFAGVGGNAIAFARSGRWERIFAVERDPDMVAAGRRNAAVYGVANRIWWVEGDCFEVVRGRLKGVVGEAVLFGSPPWGGQGYRDAEVMGLQGMRPYGLGELLGVAGGRWWGGGEGEGEKGGGGGGGGLVLYLPRNSDLNELAREWARLTRGREGAGKLRVTHYCMYGASKALCVFFGDFDFGRLER